MSVVSLKLKPHREAVDSLTLYLKESSTEVSVSKQGLCYLTVGFDLIAHFTSR